MKILTICGSPRKGNSEAVSLRIKELLEKRGVENEIILLREKNIERCSGCVEYCGRELRCWKKDDFAEIRKKMEQAQGYVFVSPAYFNMPPGIFKDLIDRCCVLYAAKTDFSGKSAMVIALGEEKIEEINACLKNISENFCGVLGIPVAAEKSFRSKSELKGNFNDIFENNLNAGIEKELEEMAERLYSCLQKQK